MDPRVKIALAFTGVAIVAYSAGYHKATTKVTKEFGGAIAKEALIYLAANDHIRHLRGR